MHISDLMDATQLLNSFGPWALAGLGLIIFIESGVLFPFLPGDSLLVTAAILKDQLNLTVVSIIGVGVVAAFLGDQVGFYLGHKFGRKLFSEDARVLKLEYLHKAEAFFAKHGPLALILGRFVPIVRTYVPVSAGTVNMKYRNFIVWNVTGAVLWIVSMTLVGVLLGGIPGIADRIDLIVLVIVGISLLPVIVSSARGYLVSRRQAKES